MLLVLVVLPIAFALVAALPAADRARPALVPIAGGLHLALTLWLITWPGPTELGGWLVLDPLNRVVLPLISVLFFVCALYVPGYLAFHPTRPRRLFCVALLAFLGMMTLIVVSHHLGLMWVALEANTLASAPLLYFNNNPRSLEATWKYILIGGVGVALALLGSFFLAYAALHAGLSSSLLVDDLVSQATQLSRPWLHTAFVILFVGYGTKMGLAPMHTWKPDAYGEAPGLVGALLAAGLTSCAFCALLRFVQILYAAGDGALARQLLLVLGLVSIAVAAVFLARQRDFKRMLAYSSVEHMGIIAFGFGIGGRGTYGALLHLINNGLAKGVLFLAAANIHRTFGSKSTDDVSGAIHRMPVSAVLFLAGFFAVTASPPFGLFYSELVILKAAFATGHYWQASVFIVLLAVVFMGMGSTVMRVVLGPAPRSETAPGRESLLTTAPPLCFLAIVLVLGLYVPPWLQDALDAASRFIEANP